MTFRPTLWSVMREAAGDEQALRKHLREATADQLVLLRWYAQQASAALAAPAVAPWVVSQGQRAWQDAIHGRSTLPERPPPGAWDPATVIADVYSQRFGGEIPAQEPPPSIDEELEPAWEAKLWEAIDVANAGVPLEQVLSGYTRAELVKLGRMAAELVERMSEEAAAKLGAHPTMPNWGLWAEWMLGKGKAAYDAALADPARETEPPEEESVFRDALDELYQHRYGVRIEGS